MVNPIARLLANAANGEKKRKVPAGVAVFVEFLGRNPNRARPLGRAGQAVEDAWRSEARRIERIRYQVVKGSGQYGRRRARLPVQPTIKVTDALGRPIVPVGVANIQFVASNGGMVENQQVPINAQTGVATCGHWTLGAAGINTLEAQVNGDVVALFRAVAY